MSSVLLLDLKIVLHSLVSEPVFIIPLISFLFHIEITNEILIIIIIYQILSAVSLQMGKYVPPEFSTGAVVSFILFVFNSTCLSSSILMGLFASLLMIPVFEVKIRLNKILGKRFRYSLAVLISIFISIAIYIFVFLVFILLSNVLWGGLTQNNNLVIFSLLTLPFFYAVRLKSGNEPLYFILGVTFGGMLTWINLFYF